MFMDLLLPRDTLTTLVRISDEVLSNNVGCPKTKLKPLGEH